MVAAAIGLQPDRRRHTDEYPLVNEGHEELMHDYPEKERC
jgi:hypothetical protein